MIPLLTNIALSIKATWSKLTIARAALEKIEKKHPKPPEPKRSPSWARPTFPYEEPEDITPTISARDQWVPPDELIEAAHNKNELIDQLNGYIKEIEDLGCEVCSFNCAIIRIPSQRHGIPVSLEWQLDDDNIARWHPPGSRMNQAASIHPDDRESFCW